MKKVITLLSLVLVLVSCSTTEELRESFENEVVLTEKPQLFIDVGEPTLENSEPSVSVIIEYYDGTRNNITAFAENGVIMVELGENDQSVLTVEVRIVIQQGQGNMGVYLYSSNMDELYGNWVDINEDDVIVYNFDYQELLNQ
jgi:hypothetical protein